jgi:hypothetical protein
MDQLFFQNKMWIRAGQLAGLDFFGNQKYSGTWLMEPLGYALGNLFSSICESFNPAGMQRRLLNTYSSKFATGLNLSIRSPLAARLSNTGGSVLCFCGTDRPRDERRGSIPSFRIL